MLAIVVVAVTGAMVEVFVVAVAVVAGDVKDRIRVSSCFIIGGRERWW